LRGLAGLVLDELRYVDVLLVAGDVDLALLVAGVGQEGGLLVGDVWGVRATLVGLVLLLVTLLLAGHIRFAESFVFE